MKKIFFLVFLLLLQAGRVSAQTSFGKNTGEYGKNEASVTIAYGPTGKKVGYDFKHDPSSKTISLQMRGEESRQYDFRILLPAGVRKARATSDGKQLPLQFETVRNSVYTVAIVNGTRPNILVRY